MLRIRRPEAGDIDALARFNVRMAAETEDKPLAEATVRAGVRAVIEDPQKGFYLLAEDDGRLTGQLLVTYEWSDWRNASFWWIQSVYVVPEARRSGVYRALQERVLSLAREAGGVCGIRLYVERENRAAKATYEALGMRPTRYDLYEMELSEG